MPLECLEYQQLSNSTLDRPVQSTSPSRTSFLSSTRDRAQKRRSSDADIMDAPQFKTDDFRMLVMKVQPCSKRFCHDWTVCPFAHPGEKARRRDPRTFSYTGIACPDMKKDNTCPRGDACPYAHNVFEYWLHPTRYRTQLCNDGERCNRHVCFFAHTLEELRVPSIKPFVPPEALAVASMEAAALGIPQAQAQKRAPDVDPEQLAAQLAWLRLGGGLDMSAPSPTSVMHLQDSLGDSRLSTGNKSSSFGDPRASMADRRPSLNDHRHGSMSDSRLPFVDATSSLAELRASRDAQKMPTGGDVRLSLGDQRLEQQAVSYLAHLQQQQQQQQQQDQHAQPHQHMYDEARGQGAPQAEHGVHYRGDHQNAPSGPQSQVSWEDGLMRARSRSDPLGYRAGPPSAFPEPVMAQHQLRSDQRGPNEEQSFNLSRLQGRSLDAALRALQMRQQAQAYSSGLGSQFEEAPGAFELPNSQDWHQFQHQGQPQQQPQPQQQQQQQQAQHMQQHTPETHLWGSESQPSLESYLASQSAHPQLHQLLSSHSHHSSQRDSSGSGPRLSQHQQMGQMLGGMPPAHPQGQYGNMRESSSRESGSAHALRGSHSHSQDSMRAMGMLWGEQQPRRASFASANSTNPHPMRLSLNRTGTSTPGRGSESWENEQQHHSHQQQQHQQQLWSASSPLPAGYPETEAQSQRSSMSSRPSDDRTRAPQAGQVPDYSSWLMPPATSQMASSGALAIPEGGFPEAYLGTEQTSAVQHASSMVPLTTTPPPSNKFPPSSSANHLQF